MYVHVYFDPERFKRDLDELMVKIEAFQLKWKKQDIDDLENDDGVVGS